MNLNIYLDKKVQIILNNDFTYIGKVIDADENSITLIDKNNSKVCIKENTISLLKEVEDAI